MRRAVWRTRCQGNYAGKDVPDSAEERIDEVRHLRGCINDLLGLLALPAMWSDRQPPQIVETLLDALVGILRLDFIYARLKDETDAQPVEAVRLAQYQPALQPQMVGRALAAWLTSDPFALPLTVPNPTRRRKSKPRSLLAWPSGRDRTGHGRLQSGRLSD